MKLRDMLDIEQLESLIRDGYIKRNYHATEPLAILNYTSKAQSEKAWGPIVCMCRGLIYHRESGDVVARPMKKFFNLGEQEHASIPDEKFVVQEKLDGSMGIGYLDFEGVPSIATRGSFHSSQADVAREILVTQYNEDLDTIGSIMEGYTLSFEIIYPENRIVVDYENMRDIVLIAVIETATGKELSINEITRLMSGMKMPFHRPKMWSWTYASVGDIEENIDSSSFDGEEGVVLVFETGHRLKIKRLDYIRMHRIITGITPRKIWKMMITNNPSTDSLFVDTPTKFKNWCREIILGISSRAAEINNITVGDFYEIMAVIELSDRVAFAREAKKRKYPSLLFRLYDEQSIRDAILKRLDPGPYDPFMKEGDE